LNYYFKYNFIKMKKISLVCMSMSTSKFIRYCQKGLSIGLGYGSVAYGVGYVYGHLSSHTSPPLSAAVFGISQAAYRTLSYTAVVWQREREKGGLMRNGGC
jgi:hypothetical protein